MTSLSNNNDYINTTDYTKLKHKLTEVKSILDDQTDKTVASRRLRYSEIDIEVEREAGRIQPDEMYIPVHTIDTNIRREQSSYIQFIAQSPRAVICHDLMDEKVDLASLDKDLTKKLRYPGWQKPLFATVDGFQADGFQVVEVVQDKTCPGHVAHEQVQSSDFAFVSDTRDLQSCEMLGRTYHYTKTKLLSLCGDPKNPKPDSDWDEEQVEKVISKDSPASSAEPLESSDEKDKSLYKIQKIMFRVNGVVQVGWACIGVGDDWLRAPRPLYIGTRRPFTPEELIQKTLVAQQTGQQLDPTVLKSGAMVDETEYPYVLFQYLISENDTITHLKGRVYLDQDVQEGVSSLLSSTVTQARRAAGMYGSKDSDDPNDDILMQSNVYFKPNCLINKKVSFTHLDAPEAGIFSAIQMLQSSNQQETSQINFAENNNQRDSRKTATAIKESRSQRQELTSVQVVLFSLALTELYTKMVGVIKSRVLCGLIAVDPSILPLYSRTFSIKPSGDVDVVERQELIQTMVQAWPILQNTPAGPTFLCDLLEKLFPDTAVKYIQLIMQGQQQQQSQQAQQQQQMMQFAQSLGLKIIELSKHKDFFSEVGLLHAWPVVQDTARQVEQVQEQLQKQQGKK
jgi:3D (Asp-Asp-Asp) domain-containing protein